MADPLTAADIVHIHERRKAAAYLVNADVDALLAEVERLKNSNKYIAEDFRRQAIRAEAAESALKGAEAEIERLKLPTLLECRGALKWQERAEAAEAALKVAEQERDHYRFSPQGDNHHNAWACPYCNPEKHDMLEMTAAACSGKIVEHLYDKYGAALRSIAALIDGQEQSPGVLRVMIREIGRIAREALGDVDAQP